MLGFIGNMIGKAAKGVVEVGEYCVDEVIDLPSNISKGYEEGFIPTKDDKEVEVRVGENTTKVEGKSTPFSS